MSLRPQRVQGSALALLLLLASPAYAQRVVSLNLCTDQYLIALAPERAAAVTFLSRDRALSVFYAPTIPVVRADAEAVLAHRPDLVLAGPWGARATLAALERRGVRVAIMVPPTDFDAIRSTTRRMGELLGAVPQAKAMLAEMEARLAAVPRTAQRRAIALEPRGLTAGPGSLRDAVLRAAGLENAADGRPASLEALARMPPTLLLVPQKPRTPSLASDWLGHPLLARHTRREVPAAFTVCGGPWTAEAVMALGQ